MEETLITETLITDEIERCSAEYNDGGISVTCVYPRDGHTFSRSRSAGDLFPKSFIVHLGWTPLGNKYVSWREEVG